MRAGQPGTQTQPPTPQGFAGAAVAVSGSLSCTETSSTDMLACGLFEDELEELMQAHSPKVRCTDSVLHLDGGGV